MAFIELNIAFESQLILRLLVLCWIFGGFSNPPTFAQSQSLEFDRGKVFDEVRILTQEHVYDAEAVGESWNHACNQFRPRALAATSHAEFSEVINQLLATLKVSHTCYFSASHQRRHQFLGIFDNLVPKNRDELFLYESIGIETVGISDRTFVRAVYDGFPASKHGLLFGDEIVSIDDKAFDEIESFRGKKEVRLQVRRIDEGPIETHQIPVVRLNGRLMFEEAMAASAQIIERGQKKIAYVHVWSYAGSRYQDQLREMLLFGQLKTADALILDLRDGWGGASLEYLNLFRESIANVKSRPRTGEPFNFSGAWGKPVALLVNQRSTSGKELFAFGFKKLKLGEVIGERTAGAVVAGRGFLLSNDDVLYLAVSDIEIDGKRLEGEGVAPTIPVERPLPYAGGADPQLERALELLGK